jgi:hypothetical protein
MSFCVLLQDSGLLCIHAAPHKLIHRFHVDVLRRCGVGFEYHLVLGQQAGCSLFTSYEHWLLHAGGLSQLILRIRSCRTADSKSTQCEPRVSQRCLPSLVRSSRQILSFVQMLPAFGPTWGCMQTHQMKNPFVPFAGTKTHSDVLVS